MKERVVMEDGDTFTASHVRGEVVCVDGFECEVWSDVITLVTGKASRRRATIPEILEAGLFTFLKWKLKVWWFGHVSAEDVSDWEG